MEAYVHHVTLQLITASAVLSTPAAAAGGPLVGLNGRVVAARGSPPNPDAPPPAPPPHPDMPPGVPNPGPHPPLTPQWCVIPFS